MGLLEKIKAGKRNIKTIAFPGTDREICLQVLTNHETQEAVFATENYFKRVQIEITATTLDAYEDERVTQILFRALKDPEDIKNSITKDADELRRLLTKEDKELLLQLYTEYERECSPNFTQMSDNEFETLWEDLKKNPIMLSSVSNIGMLKRLLLYLASAPETSQKGNGSTS